MNLKQKLGLGALLLSLAGASCAYTQSQKPAQENKITLSYTALLEKKEQRDKHYTYEYDPVTGITTEKFDGDLDGIVDCYSVYTQDRSHYITECVSCPSIECSELSNYWGAE